MKKYSLVKKSLAVTLSGILLFSLGSYFKKDAQSDSYVKVINENGEELVVLAFIDKISETTLGDEKLGYINEDLTFNSVTNNFKINLKTYGNTNCDIYYINYVDCLSEDEISSVKINNEILLDDLIEFENNSYVFNKFGTIKLSNDKKETNLKKLDQDTYFSDSDTDLEKVIKK